MAPRAVQDADHALSSATTLFLPGLLTALLKSATLSSQYPGPVVTRFYVSVRPTGAWNVSTVTSLVRVSCLHVVSASTMASNSISYASENWSLGLIILDSKASGTPSCSRGRPSGALARVSLWQEGLVLVEYVYRGGAYQCFQYCFRVPRPPNRIGAVLEQVVQRVCGPVNV